MEWGPSASHTSARPQTGEGQGSLRVAPGSAASASTTCHPELVRHAGLRHAEAWGWAQQPALGPALQAGLVLPDIVVTGPEEDFTCDLRPRIHLPGRAGRWENSVLSQAPCSGGCTGPFRTDGRSWAAGSGGHPLGVALLPPPAAPVRPSGDFCGLTHCPGESLLLGAVWLGLRGSLFSPDSHGDACPGQSWAGGCARGSVLRTEEVPGQVRGGASGGDSRSCQRTSGEKQATQSCRERGAAQPHGEVHGQSR